VISLEARPIPVVDGDWRATLAPFTFNGALVEWSSNSFEVRRLQYVKAKKFEDDISPGRVEGADRTHGMRPEAKARRSSSRTSSGRV
jgi:hypothetical protein